VSTTYDILCHDCKVHLWIGQARRLYSTPEHVEKLGAFLFQHIGHKLEFRDSYHTPDDYLDLDPPDDS
jgi:hypothetical protein